MMTSNPTTANATVQILATQEEWFPSEDEPPPIEWREVWSEEVPVGASAKPGPLVDLLVAPPDFPLERVEELRATRPGMDLLVATQHGDPRVDQLLGDQSVFFMVPPTTAGQLRTCVREVLSYRAERRQLVATGNELPELDQLAPVAGWLELTGPSHPVFLRRFRAWMASLRTLPFDDRERSRLEHAVREVGWNAIEWGNRFDMRRSLQLAFLTLEDRLVLRVQDEGGAGDWFDGLVQRDAAEEQQRRASHGLRYGGFGLKLVEKIMDRVEVSSKGHIVVMEKLFPGKDNPSADAAQSTGTPAAETPAEGVL